MKFNVKAVDNRYARGRKTMNILLARSTFNSFADYLVFNSLSSGLVATH